MMFNVRFLFKLRIRKVVKSINEIILINFLITFDRYARSKRIKRKRFGITLKLRKLFLFELERKSSS